MKKIFIIILFVTCPLRLFAQTGDFTERVIKAFPDIRFDLIDDDWQNDTYLKPYLEKRLVLMAHDSLSILKNQATEANDTVRINQYVELMNVFFKKNIEYFEKLSTLLDSCIIHSYSELLLALLLQNWDNTDLEKIKRVNENRNDLSRNSYYGKIFEQQLENRSQKMTKIDYLYAVIVGFPDWETGKDVKLKLEYNLLHDNTIDKLIIIFKRMVDRINDIIKDYRQVREKNMVDATLTILDYFQITTMANAELQSIQELLNQ